MTEPDTQQRVVKFKPLLVMWVVIFNMTPTLQSSTSYLLSISCKRHLSCDWKNEEWVACVRNPCMEMEVIEAKLRWRSIFGPALHAIGTCKTSTIF